MSLLLVPSAPAVSISVSCLNSCSITRNLKLPDCIDRNGNITGYSVWYGVYGSNNDSIDVSTRKISELFSNTTYTIEVAAVNSGGIGKYSKPEIVDVLPENE